MYTLLKGGAARLCRGSTLFRSLARRGGTHDSQSADDPDPFLECCYSDSGLDVDALKKIAAAINLAHKQSTAILLITHYQRILKYLKPNKVHVLTRGKLVKSGGPELAREIEKKGYEHLQHLSSRPERSGVERSR